MVPEKHTRQLGWFLAWAVVFCDIGTSVYYVPGILYGNVGDFAPLFVLLATVGFVLLSMKYVEISWRNPEGGGVVTVATKAFGPIWGCFGGMLITVDYFLTAAISAVSGLHYLAGVFEWINPFIVPLACVGLGFLALLNIVGIRESATVALCMAVCALAVDLLVIGMASLQLSAAQWGSLFSHLTKASSLSFKDVLVGFGAAWLAFSGLESISQLSPALRFPIHVTARRAMGLVVLTILFTSPFLTALSVGVLAPGVKTNHAERFISELGTFAGGLPLKLAVVLTATSLLLFASNTAVIGAYHVFLALADREFLPAAVRRRNIPFNTPHVAILLATVVPMLVIISTKAHLNLLGDMYAFGLLGAFTLSSIGLDVVRWQHRHFDASFWLGLLTSGLVIGAWGINLVVKELATLFGGGLTILGMLTAIGIKNGWFMSTLTLVPAFRRRQARAYAAAESAAGSFDQLVTLREAVELKNLYPSSTLIAVRGDSSKLVQEAATRCKGRGEASVYGLYVEEWPGLFDGGEPHRPNEEGVRSLRSAMEEAQQHSVELIPVWSIASHAAQAIAHAARELDVDCVMVGVSRRSALYHMLRGHVVNGLAKRLPRTCRLMICN
jgi:amino acid transporter/nucleotide-binding universal stress UspA family protein